MRPRERLDEVLFTRSWFGLCVVLLAGLIVLLAGCTSVPFERGSLREQILTASHGHVGLVSRRCLESDNGECVKPDVVTYDLSDASNRAQLNELKFICNMGNKLFDVCVSQPGFCHYRYEGGWFSKKLITEYIDQSEVDRLVNGLMICYSRDRYKAPL